MANGTRQRCKKRGDQIIEKLAGMAELSIALLYFQNLRHD
jgi:hypothetical protein